LWGQAGAQITTRTLIRVYFFIQTTFEKIMIFFAMLFSCADSSVDSEKEIKDPYLSAPLQDTSDGECPDMSVSGATTSFSSYGQMRNVTTVFPASSSEPPGITFFFHGLMDPSSTPNPSQYMAESMDLQEFADAENMVVVLPESGIWELLGMTFFLWQIEDGTSAPDLTLYDDLRTCAVEHFEANRDRVVAAGFSGGSLLTTVVLSERGDTLAAAVEMSGGANFEVATFEEDFAKYRTPAHQFPVLLSSGGTSDVWPDPTFTVVDFQEGTDILAEKLLEDGHTVGRCQHNSGHTITWDIWDLALTWLSVHEYDQGYQLDDLSSWGCSVDGD
jgi:poly(3-hydroxybutyrate) depolymerase